MDILFNVGFGYLGVLFLCVCGFCDWFSGFKLLIFINLFSYLWDRVGNVFIVCKGMWGC